MKERLDVLLVRGGYFTTREKAKAVIMAGQVYVNGQKEDKAGTKFDVYSRLEVRGNPLPYVSRGGLKLEKAVRTFDIDLSGRICMDVGASTGGFTDCMLQNGAVKVYSIDVGHGQLDWKLRNDERVVCMEKFNARYLTPEDIPDHPAFSSIDVSFISLTKILLPVSSVLSEDGRIAALIKPQFEAGREKVGKKGVVRDPKIHGEVVRLVRDYALSIGLIPCGLTFSPIRGPEGNIEYLIDLRKQAKGTALACPEDEDPSGTVPSAGSAAADSENGDLEAASSKGAGMDAGTAAVCPVTDDLVEKVVAEAHAELGRTGEDA